MGTNSETRIWYYAMMRDLGTPSSKSCFPWKLREHQRRESRKNEVPEEENTKNPKHFQSTCFMYIWTTQRNPVACTGPAGLWIRWGLGAERQSGHIVSSLSRSNRYLKWNLFLPRHLNGKQKEGCRPISKWTTENELTGIFGGSFSQNLMMSCQDFSVFQFCYLFYIIYIFPSFTPQILSYISWLLT